MGKALAALRRQVAGSAEHLLDDLPSACPLIRIVRQQERDGPHRTLLVEMQQQVLIAEQRLKLVEAQAPVRGLHATHGLQHGESALVDGPLRRVHLDHARANTISDNLFWTVDDGIRIEDDDTQVVGNDFRSADPTDRAVVLGTRERAEVLGQPTAGTVLTANTAAIEGNPDPYQWVWPHVGTVDDANTSAGLPSALVPGDPPTIGPFLHVVEVWLP